MAVPRKKISRSRRNSRRAHHSLEATPAASVCPKCLSPKLHHHACTACGYYKGREVIKVDTSA